METFYQSEVRSSEIRNLLERVKKQNISDYLLTLRLERIRQFKGGQIRFDFPVTAVVGPNGSGKTTLLLAAACIYKSTNPKILFRKSRVGDTSMDDWSIDYELICKNINPKGTIKETVTFKENHWQRSNDYSREVKHIGISRTLPATDNPAFLLRNRLSIHGKLKPKGGGTHSITEHPVEGIDHIKAEAEKILGKSLKDFKLVEVRFTTEKKIGGNQKQIESRQILAGGREVITYLTIENPKKTKTISAKQRLYFGGDGTFSYSEFSFGAGEASIIHLVADIEELPDGSLVLIDEIENGLHPLAVCRLVDYLITVADRKRLQIIFTTHSDYALAPLPSEAIWASIDGRLQQGKLSVEVLRAVSGRIDKRLAVFVEDEFAKRWVEAIIRDRLGNRFEEVGVYALHGDGIAVGTHLGHSANPAISFHSVCIVDGDSKQKDDASARIYRLPGGMPEEKIFNDIVANLVNNIALLTVACHQPIQKQQAVADVIKEVGNTNRDPHLLFSQIGIKLGFAPEATIAGAFFSIWISEHEAEVNAIALAISQALELPPKK
jgi:predicted ATPase